jgi:hypothetical protein
VPSVTVTMKSYPEHDLGNDGEEGVTTEISKQLQCDIRDYTKARYDILDNLRVFLQLSVTTEMIGKKGRTRNFLTPNGLDCHSLGVTPEIRPEIFDTLN